MRKILIVDDDKASRILITEILEGANVVIIECGCDKEAISLFEQYYDDIELVLMDIKLPGCDGWELLKQFRKVKPSIKAIAISAMFPSELACGSRAAGFNAYISKPFCIDDFSELINSYI
jgi:CheY-like chemotaxis protein